MLTTIDEQIKSIIELHKNNEFLEAESLYVKILEQNFNNSDILNILGIFKYKNKQFDDAMIAFKRAAELTPSPNSYKNLGEIYIYKLDFASAINCFKEAIKLDENNFNSWFLLAYAFKSNNEQDKAISAYEKALSLNPNSPQIYHNLGNIHFYQNNPIKAIKFYEKFLEYEPDNTDAKSCLGTLYLKLKNYKDGWEYYECCVNKALAIADMASKEGPFFSLKPVWQGENIKDKTIYVYYDGGFGDIIMFARFLPLLKAKCAKVKFRPPECELKLFQENNFGAEILDKNSTDLNFDVHTPLMSLPYKLQINSEKDIPFPEKYLNANINKVEFYNQKYFNTDKFKIGIKWQGDTTFDLTRKIKLKSFYELFSLTGAKFYSLQRDDGIEQLQDAKEYDIVDLGSTFEDFSDTAGAIENLDLVICNDTSVAHLAGALGKPCWVVLPYSQDWRWSADISYCPWYNHIRLFKQTKPTQWKEVFNEVYLELKKKIGSLK